MIKPQTRITTNIDSGLLTFVDKLAKERESTRRDIIEQSIKKLELEAREKKLMAEFNQMADDKELMEEWLAIANNPANLKW